MQASKARHEIPPVPLSSQVPPSSESVLALNTRPSSSSCNFARRACLNQSICAAPAKNSCQAGWSLISKWPETRGGCLRKQGPVFRSVHEPMAGTQATNKILQNLELKKHHDCFPVKSDTGQNCKGEKGEAVLGHGSGLVQREREADVGNQEDIRGLKEMRRKSPGRKHGGRSAIGWPCRVRSWPEA